MSLPDLSRKRSTVSEELVESSSVDLPDMKTACYWILVSVPEGQTNSQMSLSAKELA